MAQILVRKLETAVKTKLQRAGIVLANHATLATRNVKHFEDIAKWVVNPWG